jgi:hypothetical protein
MPDVSHESRAMAVADDDPIRDAVRRLSRPHASGGKVIESAAVLAEGTDSTEIIRWILAHDGEPEELAAAAPSGGLFGARRDEMRATHGSQVRRYVLPAGALA